MRGTKAIIGSFFHKKGQMGAQASPASLFASIGFVMVIMCVFLSWIIWWFPYYLFSDEVYNIVVVNGPESFIAYNEDMQEIRDQVAQDNKNKQNKKRILTIFVSVEKKITREESLRSLVLVNG